MMRTYTRKRPHHELIKDVHELCRLCLNKVEEAMPIFTDDPKNICATLALRIMICVGLEVKKEECLPNVICSNCYNELNKYYTFRKKCEVTYQKLKSHVLAFKENLYKEQLLREAEQKRLEEENEEGMKFVVTFEKDQFPEVNLLNLNGVAQVNNFVGHNLPDLTKEHQQDDGTEIEIKVIDDTEQVNSPLKYEEQAFQNNLVQPSSLCNPAITQTDQNFVNSSLMYDEQPFQTQPSTTIHHHPSSLCNPAITQILPNSYEEQQAFQNNLVQPSSLCNPAISQTLQNSPTLEGEPSCPDITEFLSTMLLELGILTQQEGGLVYSNQNITTLELENGDGSLVQWELVEEDDEEEQVQEQVQEALTEEPQDTPKETEASSIENHFAIKYVTSNPNRRGRPKKVDKNGKGGAWCKECGKRLATGSALTRHMRTHSGEKPYACATCGRTFAQKEVMQRHVLVHEDNRPHKCSVCDKSFTQRNSLVSHARAHAPPNARPLALHRCDKCPKVFLYASGLSRHMMMHNGRVYVCVACERQFKDKSSLMRHLRNANHEPRPADVVAT